MTIGTCPHSVEPHKAKALVGSQLNTSYRNIVPTPLVVRVILRIS